MDEFDEALLEICRLAEAIDNTVDLVLIDGVYVPEPRLQ